VGATLAEALVRPPAGPWDAVVIDEGAMAHVPYALWAASLATRRLLVWGDPHQLGPVCALREPAARDLLGRSLFHHLGCDHAASEDPRRPVLRVQHRMAPPIRRLVDDAFYGGVLRDGAVAHGRPGTVEVIDSAGLARARTVGTSRANEAHARMAAARVARLWQDGVRRIAILTPYRAQVDCLRAAIRERVPGLEGAGGLIGTVHTAQGGEHEAVVVDLVATRDDPGRFLDERSNPEAPSLLCVALSRARTSLTVLADVAALPPGGVARRAVAAARQARAA
jgi:superfamily I DNA and/or RNA helicase